MRGSIACAMIGACLWLSACGGSEPAPSFAMPDYSYLPPLRLNVETLTVIDHASDAAATASDQLAENAPVTPDQALRQMAHDRLKAVGNSGSGTFTIDQASITGSDDGVLDGHLAVHLDILTASGSHAGYAEAHVSRRFVPGEATSSEGTRARLYDLTQQMMQDMNVELEYQTRKSLKDWLVDASGAPIATGVEQQNLPPPGAAPVSSGVSSPVGATPLGATPLAPAPLPSAPATGASVQVPQSPPAPLRSPPPGFLQLPPGSAAALSPAPSLGDVQK